MSNKQHYDIAVVGAGPAGSVAAYAAAVRGLRVALIDQRSFPRDKSCGDGIGPGGARLLKRLRLDPVLADAVPIGAISIVGPDGTEARADVPVVDGEPQHGYVMDRKTFDNRLFAAACQAGADDYTGHKLQVDPEIDAAGAAIRNGQRSMTLRRGAAHDSNAQEVQLSCRLLVGADGAYSSVRRLLGAPAHPCRHTLLAMRAYADVPTDFEPRLMFEFSRELLPGYGWIFPSGAGWVNVGVGLTLSNTTSAPNDIRSQLSAFVARARERGLSIGPLRGHRSHHLPTAAHIPQLRYWRAALVGDSAAMINPMSGEGIVYAMTAATALVEKLPADLTDEHALHCALTDYQLWYQRSYRAHMRANHLATRIMARPNGANWAIRAAHRNPDVMSAAVKLLFDLGHIPRRTLAKGLLRAALG
ncbi:MAG: geranylgeranyl reductase family protein [Mycobacteriales bacterium]